MNFDNLDHDKLTLCLKRLVSNYPFLKLFSIGKSHMQKDIWCIKVGKGYKKILIIATHHALEWITAAVSVGFIQDFSQGLRENMTLSGMDVYDVYSRVQYYVIPMLNPDGVDIVINSIDESHPYFKSVCSVAPPDKIPYLWQANIRGVDLNHNYDCRFREGVILAQKAGITAPHYTRFSGEYCFSEPETRAVKRLLEDISFHSAIALHTQGRVIYPGEYISDDYILFANSLKNASGYELSEPEGVAACSGFKDWAMEKLHIPSFTVELGCGKNPLPFSQFEKIKNPCYNIIMEASNH